MSIFINELEDLLEYLQHNGRCTDDTGACRYVESGHGGCAVGRRLTLQEQPKWSSYETNNVGNRYSMVQAWIGIPQFFKDWPIELVDALQEVHDSYTRPHHEHTIEAFHEEVSKHESK